MFSVKKTVKKTITSPFSPLVKKTVKKNPKGVKSFFQPMKKKLEKHEVIPVRIEQNILGRKKSTFGQELDFFLAEFAMNCCFLW